MAHWTPEKTLAERRQFEKDAAKALAELAHVLMIDYLRGWNGATKKNIRQAEKALDKAYTIHRSVFPLAHLAESKIREVRGDLEGSIESLDAALKLAPDLADAYAHKANALTLLGRADEALKVLTEAPELSREPGLFHWFMGRAYFNMGAFFKRRDYYEQAIEALNKSVDERATTWFSWAHLISAYALTERLEKPDADVRKAVNTYSAKFQKDWPLDKIKAYYDQPKYRGEYPQLQAGLKEYISGLNTAHNTVGVGVP
jgi:adenylate cyclase